MKVYFLILFVTLLGPDAINALFRRIENAPDCSECDDGETIADSSSCSRYYLCVGGKALKRCCARGLYFDAISGLCNRASLVDCTINRFNGKLDKIFNLRPNVDMDIHVDDNDDEEEYHMHRPIVATATPCIPTTTPCTATTTPCTPTTTPCTQTKTPCTPTKTPCTPTKTPCTPTKTPCTPTKTPCTPTKTPCNTTKAPKTPCTNNTPTIRTPCITTTCSTTKKPCTTPKTICITTSTGCDAMTTKCTTKSTPCPSTTPPCSTTTTICPSVLEVENNVQPLSYYSSRSDCLNLPEGTVLLNVRHWCRPYVCTNRRPRLQRCRPGYCLDLETRTCCPKSDATHCLAGCD